QRAGSRKGPRVVVARRRAAAARSGSRQRLQQQPRIFEVGGVEALGKPSVDLRQLVPRILVLALLPEPAREARCGAQLDRFRALVSRDRKRLTAALFRVPWAWTGSEQDQLAL